ncbi:MAG TPA: ankyrin repeat domain-containing protein [Gemmatimonadaceae bacterium]
MPMRPIDELFAASRAGDTAAAWRVLERSPELARVTGPHPIWGGEPTALHLAVENGRADVALMLLKLGADPNHPSDMYDGWTPLLLAAGRESRALVDLLLSYGANVDAWEAASLGDVDRLAALITADPAVVSTHRANDAPPLHFAASVEVAKLLIERGAPLDALDKYASTAARSAAYGRRSRRPVAKYLVELTDERDPWMLAALDDTAGLAAFALKGNDIISGRRIGINPASGFGETSLHTAAAMGNVATVRFLLGRGADANAEVDNGVRPLHYAAKCDSREVVDALLKAGANPNVKDGERDATPSDWARFFGKFELAGYLESVEEQAS